MAVLGQVYKFQIEGKPEEGREAIKIGVGSIRNVCLSGIFLASCAKKLNLNLLQTKMEFRKSRESLRGSQELNPKTTLSASHLCLTLCWSHSDCREALSVWQGAQMLPMPIEQPQGVTRTAYNQCPGIPWSVHAHPSDQSP